MELDRRFGGIDRLYGRGSIERVKQAHVVVIGIGGVGSWAAEALARSGVGILTLIDLDHIAESNTNRQIHATQATMGQAKVLAMGDRIHSFYPECVVHCIDQFVTVDNWATLVPSGVHAVIDACDQLKVKTTLAAWARATGTPFVASGAAGGKRQAHLASIADLTNVTHDPLLAKVRNQLRKEHHAPRDGKKTGVMCVYSAEPVALPDASCLLGQGDGTLNCHGFGSVVTVTATFGLLAASYVLNQLAG